MDVQSLSCNNCGAPLEVSPNANYVTCSYCKARLAIKRNASTAYTEVLTQIGENTGQMAGDLRFMRLKQQLQILDEHWQEQDQQFRQQQTTMQPKIESANKGNLSTRVYSIIALIIGIVVLLGPFYATGDSNDTGIWGVLIVAFAALGIWVSASSSSTHKNLVNKLNNAKRVHDEAKDAYQAQRADISSKLDEAWS
jgi:DNA-directed RNA polymerase subunit RPC12/RpoP